MNDRIEWTLDKHLFTNIQKRYYSPKVDLFASRLNHQLTLYVARRPDPGQWLWMRSYWIIHTPSNYTAEQNSTQTSSAQSNSLGDSPAMVPYAPGNVSRLSSSAPNIEENNFSFIRPNGCPPIMEDSSSGCMASLRRRMQATGVSEAVMCDVLLASWRSSAKKL